MIQLDFVLAFSPVIVFVALAILIVIFTERFFNSRKFRVSSALEKKGTKKIGEVTEGEYVQIQGKIFPAGEIIKAPLTGRECVYYHVKIEQLVTKLYSPGLIHSRFGAHIPEWKTVSEDEMMADVVITDGKDFAFVDCNHPLTYLVPDDDFVSVEDSAPDVQRFIKKPFFRQLFLQLLISLVQFADAVFLNLTDIHLILAAAFIDRYRAIHHDLHPIG